jgi:hypothetical protein
VFWLHWLTLELQYPSPEVSTGSLPMRCGSMYASMLNAVLAAGKGTYPLG